MIRLTPAAAYAIARHAEATYPNECVGLLLGQINEGRKTVSAIYPVDNTWEGQVNLAESDDPQSQRDRFYLDPRDYLRADRAAREQGLDVVGCFHSHPDHPARPSERDLVGAQGVGGGPAFAFVIQAVEQGRAAELTSWLLLDAGSRFVPEALELVISSETDSTP
jgi:proteasome lid subunit RPN8/RPN11